ncbi:MAG: ATP-binding protein [Candidatus Melainabacteria bacterium]|nr:ATP-binding protein [Candidatus Melainabacteria bacterium]
MIERKIAEKALYLAEKYPILTITGPRQSGKTTLAQALFPEKPYVNLEKPDIREFAINDPNAFLAKYENGAVIDEVQRAPKLFSYLQVLVDQKKQNNLFILSGSQHFGLLENISQSLAGRTGIVTLLPLSIEELIDRTDLSFQDFIYRGFYPKIYNDDLNPTDYYRDYVQTYLERDLRDLKAVHDLELFKKFMRLCAVRIGQPLNYTNISADLGASENTVKDWINVLATSYVIKLLPAYFANIKKRLVKAPKLYFHDVGLASYLAGIENINHVQAHPIYGMLFENLCVNEALKARYNRGLEANIFFYKDTAKEVDLIFDRGSELIPVEIKSGSTVHEDHFSGLKYFEKVFPKKIKSKTLIYAGEEQERSYVNIINPRSIYSLAISD